MYTVYYSLYLKLTRPALSGHPNYCVRPSPADFYYLFILFHFRFFSFFETLQNTDSLCRIVSCSARRIDRGASFLAPESPRSYLSLVCASIYTLYRYIWVYICILYINIELTHTQTYIDIHFFFTKKKQIIIIIISLVNPDDLWPGGGTRI